MARAGLCQCKANNQEFRQVFFPSSGTQEPGAILCYSQAHRQSAESEVEQWQVEPAPKWDA